MAKFGFKSYRRQMEEDLGDKLTEQLKADLNPGEEAMFEVAIATSLNTFKLQSKRFMVYAR